jgi:hypothetical protein
MIAHFWNKPTVAVATVGTLSAAIALGIWQPAQAAVTAFAQISPNPTNYVLGEDFSRFVAGNLLADGTFSPTGFPAFVGEATGNLQVVSGFGCATSDFGSFSPGNIALILRGSCFFSPKIENATNAGASGVIIYNDSRPFLGDGEVNYIVDDLQSGVNYGPMTVPSIFIQNALGVEFANLLGSGPVNVRVGVGDEPRAVVPEPTSVLGLLVLGGLGIGSALKRNRTQH